MMNIGYRTIAFTPLLLTIMLLGAVCLSGGLWLLLHNQSQTEYLIYFDFWRNYNVLLGNGLINEYIFHFVHTYAIASLLWYIDVLFAGGSLKLLHLFVLALTVGAFICLVPLSLRFFNAAAVKSSNSLIATIAAMALWLTPSASFGLAYPLVDIMASTLLLSLLLYAIISARMASTYISNPIFCIHLVTYLSAAVLGFFSLEVFITAPLFLIVDAMLRKRYTEALLHLLIVAILLGLYFGLRELLPVFTAPASSSERDYLAFAHNFLMFLSMHFLMLFGELNFDPTISANLTIIASALQLLTLFLFASSHYSSSSRTDLTPRFALLLAVFGIVSIALATWLRFSIEIVTTPVDRYTFYSVIFSMGVLFLASRSLAATNGFALRFASLMTLLVIFVFLLVDAWSFWFRLYNPASRFAQMRMEMSVYATAPGSEIDLGPSTPGAGLAFRSKLYEPLMTRELSVFGSAGFLGIGKPLPSMRTAGGTASCKILQQQVASDLRPDLVLSTFQISGLSDAGVFLTTDANAIVTGFGFAAKRHPAQKSVATLLPRKSETGQQIHYALVQSSQLLTSIPCR